MHSKHVGRQTVQFDDPPSVIASAAIAGKKEGEGPLKQFFDHIGNKTFLLVELDICCHKPWDILKYEIIRLDIFNQLYGIEK